MTLSCLRSASHAWAWRALCAAQLTLLLSACSTIQPAPGVTSASTGKLHGEVLGRNERFVIYAPASGESAEDIAAHFLGSPELDWRITDFNQASKVEVGKAIVVPLQTPNPMGVSSERYQTVPILCYHRFGNGTSGKGASGKMTVSASDFAAQLDWLARNDFHVLHLKQLQPWLEGKQALPKRSVIITADDGYASFYRIAFPLLKKYNFPATLFVYTDFVGAADAADWSQLQEMVNSGLVSVQAHSRTHRNLIERMPGETDERYQQALVSETRVPREMIERKLGAAQPHFAYPYGDANEAVLDVLSRQGAQLGLTVNPGGNGFFAHPLMLKRTMIFGDMSLDDFKARLQTARSIDSK
jgi:peptidoglycan/xylan/chitin deacetylase (PgdA/CDA1 family)